MFFKFYYKVRNLCLKNKINIYVYSYVKKYVQNFLGAPESELSKTIKGYRSSVNNKPIACINVIKNEDCRVLLSAQIYFPIKEETILYVTQINDSTCNITLKNMLP